MVDLTRPAATTGWVLGRRPALDGLRGVAILLVVLQHTGVPGFEFGGAVGVTAFFVLSGFLITSLLLEEHAETGRVDLRAFWTRRARRLLPALAFILATTTVLMWAGGMLGHWWPRLALIIGYGANWAACSR